MTTAQVRTSPPPAPATTPDARADLLDGVPGTRLPRYCGDPAAPRPSATHHVALPAAVRAVLDRCAARLGVPVTSLVLTAHVAALAFVSGSDDVLTGFAPGDRDPEEVLPLRVRVGSPRRWADLVRTVDEARTLAVTRRGPAGPGRCAAPLDTLFAARALPIGSRLAGCVLRTVVSAPGPGGLGLRLDHQPREIGGDQVTRFGRYCVRALERIVRDGSAACRLADLLGEEERTLRGFSGPITAMPGGTFVDQFDHWVRIDPDRVALTCGGTRRTYRALDEESEALAAHLRHRGLRAGEVVATVLPRGVGWAVTVLALMKAGLVYLPLAAEDPVERLASVLGTSGCRHVLAESSAAARLRADLGNAGAAVDVLAFDGAAAARSGGPPARPGPGDTAYVIFTSGSTGRPKGAVIPHSGMLNHLVAKRMDLRLGPADRVAQVATQCFDISVWQLLAAWMNGGETVIYTRFDVLDVPGFLRSLAADAITVLEVVPSYLASLLDEVARRPVPLPALRYAVVTGEALPPDLTRRWFEHFPAVPLVNAYGPTEAADDVTHHVMRGPVAGSRVPVGRAIFNTGIHVVDADGALRPMGSFGEIWVTGAGVGRGYLNDDDRTAAVFRPNTLDGRSATSYRTGDVGRWLPGGVLDCAGRDDDQIKLRGYRIELSEIDAALRRLPGVDSAVTVVRSVHGQPALVAYFAGSALPDLAAFQRGLSAVIPAYMHPAEVVRLPALPLTDRGKVDRRALTEGP